MGTDKAFILVQNKQRNPKIKLLFDTTNFEIHIELILKINKSLVIYLTNHKKSCLFLRILFCFSLKYN